MRSSSYSIVVIKLIADDAISLTHPHRTPQELVPIQGIRFGFKGAETNTITFVEMESGIVTAFQFQGGGGFFAQLIEAEKIEES